MIFLKETSEGHEAQSAKKHIHDGGEFSSRTAYLRSLLLSCISSSGADEEESRAKPGVDRNHYSTAGDGVVTVKSIAGDAGKAAGNKTEVKINPLKKYAPVSVPGWEVNIIYKPSRYNKSIETGGVLRSVSETRDVASLLDNMEGMREEALQVIDKAVQKSVFWNPVSAVQKLIKRIRVMGEGNAGERGLPELKICG